MADVTVNIRDDGPLLVQGPCVLKDQAGNIVRESDNMVALVDVVCPTANQCVMEATLTTSMGPSTHRIEITGGVSATLNETLGRVSPEMR